MKKFIYRVTLEAPSEALADKQMRAFDTLVSSVTIESLVEVEPPNEDAAGAPEEIKDHQEDFVKRMELITQVLKSFGVNHELVDSAIELFKQCQAKVSAR
jgi:hypothetical protein